MKKYDSKLVLDYILGRDITGYDVEDLENDTSFMVSVIDKTNDKKMYNLCGDDVKKDYEFVKYMVYKFKDDPKFISCIADYYLKNNVVKDDINVSSIELGIIMEELFKSTDEDLYYKYVVSNKVRFHNLCTELTSYYENDKTIKKEVDYGVGFIFIENLFKNSSITLNYYAKELIEEIFYRNKKFKFEELIHVIAKDKTRLVSENINSFIINYVSSLDFSLSWYLACHIELLDKLKKDINSIYNSWDFYDKNRDEMNVFSFEEYVDKLFSKLNVLPSFTETELIEYVIKKMRLESVFNNSDSYASFRSSGAYNSEDYNRDLLDSNNMVDIKVCNLALAKAKEIFVNNIIELEDEYINEEKPTKNAKIIKFSSKTKNKE